MTAYDYVLVGGGMAAQAAYTGIRTHDPRGSIGWFTAEAHPPYRRPPLSKGLWTGEDPDGIWYAPPDDGVDLFVGHAVTHIDRARKRIQVREGGEHSYERLLLATGGTPRRLPRTVANVNYFRTVDDYRRLRHHARRSARFVVIGGGFIGTEIAAALRRHDRAVTMIVPEEGLGGRVFPADLAKFLVGYYRERGVDVHTGARVRTVREGAGRFDVLLEDGKRVEADVVVGGLGLKPNVELAAGAGLAVGDGIEVNEYLQSTDEHIFAAGDVASVPVPALGGRRRMEHEDAAVSSGTAAGRNMTGDLQPYRHLPLFYSDLFELGYEAVGDLDSRHQTVATWTRRFEEGVVYYLHDSRIRGVLLWNAWGLADAARELILRQEPVEAGALTRGMAGLQSARVS